ncbi:hypothetical protein CHU32_19520 [Superficieibacter electus]|uniref:Uncharacterized protein n=1 Tax=Superficieibacter electus TaxID=2022662 RepID=A0A2P5GKP8_9ENTR|nr:hypothetical protein CHU33_13830 [Superficieibacter electus]POP45393.1 hypothetical protein CHU32_19520 [Superficieibacter electus]
MVRNSRRITWIITFFSHLIYYCYSSIINNKNKKFKRKSGNSLAIMLILDKIKVTTREVLIFLFIIDEYLHIVI